jgi:nicotinamide mononucleotide transporter
VWLGVNLVSVALFAYKGLWLTVLLYGLFAALSVVGWRTWKALADA